MKTTNKKVLGFVVLIVAGVGLWYAWDSGLFRDQGLSRPPTADERRRMEDIEKKSSERAPDAKAGVGVVPPGTLPPEPAPLEEATTSTPEEGTTADADAE